MEEQRNRIADTLFQAVANGESLYAILDAARTIDIAYQLQNVANVEYVSLYKGRKEEPMWDAAPYLVRCVRNSEFFNWIIGRGWGDSWGVFLTSKLDLEELRKHFQEFLMVKTADDRELYFRFYDPRVLRVFLPSCTPEESSQFFGPLSSFLLEADEPATVLKFTANWQGVKQERAPLSH
jgi:hypothetical protein